MGAELGEDAQVVDREYTFDCVYYIRPPIPPSLPRRVFMDAAAPVWGEDPGMGVAT